MNYAHAFWSKPLFNNKFYYFKISLAITLVDFALSVDCIHKNGYEITLYTDKVGAEILSAIPYDKVVIVENDITDNYHFAASMKFIALQNMPLGDCLIDGDIFLTRGRVYAEIASCQKDFMCSFFEEKNVEDLEIYKQVFTILEQEAEEPFRTKLKENFKGWINTSLMRFQNQELLDKYIDQYKTNIKLFDNKEFEQGTWPDVILEQLCLTKMLEDYDFSYIFPAYGTKEQEIVAGKLGYTHLGCVKRRLHNKLVKLLYMRNKDLYLKIEKFIEENEESYLHKICGNS